MIFFVALYANLVSLYANCMQMEKYFISIILDKRRIKASKKYPVKLRVFTTIPRKQKIYWTEFEYSESEFYSIWETSKPRSEFKERREQLKAIEDEAKDIARAIVPFDYDEFEKKMFRQGGDGILIHYHYRIRINELNRNNQLGTKTTYELAEKSFIHFLGQKKKYNDLSFYNIDSNWLKSYEHYMVETKNLSFTTVSMYLRTLRAIFNKAIDEKEIDKEIYPFGKKNYKIPASKNVKKALNKTELTVLYKAIPKITEQQKAKDFWFFSYACNGMNIKDIALLKYRDIADDKIVFYRAKTTSTTKGDLKPITVYLNDFTTQIIKKYGLKQLKKNQYIFDIINDEMDEETKRRAIQNFTRFINQHMKNLCKSNQLSEVISTYTARHSFASNFVANGGSIIDIMESLGHGNIQTTQNYLRSFDSDTKKQLSKSLIDFI